MNFSAPSERSKDLGLTALLFAIATAFFFDVLIGTGVLYFRDLTRYYYPTKRVIRETILTGDFPSWNRYYSGGQPMAANPEYEIFYPPQWLILLPDYDLGYRLHILFHIYLALGGMFALLRSMQLRRPAAFFASLSFGLGGFFLSYVNLLPILFCFAWVPLVFLFLRRLLLYRRLPDFALTALMLGMQLLSAEPTTILQTGVMMGFYALYRAWYSERRMTAAMVNVGLVALLVIAATAVGAVQIVPAIDHAGESARSRPFDFSLVGAWSMPPAKPLELVFPNVFGHISRKGMMWYWASGWYPGMGSPFIFNFYLGFLIISMVVAGAFTRQRGGRFLLLLSLFSGLLALGSHTPLLRFLYDQGIASSVRYPEKFAAMALFGMLVYGAKVLDRGLRGDREVLHAALGFSMGTAIFAGGMALFSLTAPYRKGFLELWGFKEGKNLSLMIEITQIDWITAVVRGLLLALILWLFRRGTSGRVTYPLLTLFVSIDLLPIALELNPRMPAKYMTPPPVARSYSPDPGNWRIFHEADWYGSEDPARSFFSTGRSVYWVVRNGIYPMTPASWGLRTVIERDYDKTQLLPTLDFTESVWGVKGRGRKDWAEPFMAMSNARYRAVYSTFQDEKKRTKGDFTKSLPIRFFEVQTNPRYYISDQLVAVRDKKDFVSKMAKGGWSRKVAFVGFPPFEPAPARVIRASESSNRATIEVESEGRSFLVMSVTPHKYWSATIDGTKARLEIVNIGYQGIVLPPGRHTVRMQYRNRLISICGPITIGSILVLLLILLRASSASYGIDATRRPTSV